MYTPADCINFTCITIYSNCTLRNTGNIQNNTVCEQRIIFFKTINVYRIIRSMGYAIHWMPGSRYPAKLGFIFCIAWIPKISLNVFKCCDVILLSWSWKYINLHVQSLHVYLELHCASWDFEECCPHFNAIKKNNRWVWLKWKTTFFFFIFDCFF